jgi:geranylgeranyl diphosphate synthase type II
LVATALKMGAVIANASKENADKIYAFGLNLGIAFQLQDDYLDAFGDPKTFGKQVGGDIIENKKTYLYIKALELASESEKEILQTLFDSKQHAHQQKIEKVKAIFISSGASIKIKEVIKMYTNKAFDVLDEIVIPSEKKQILKLFGENLMHRDV